MAAESSSTAAATSPSDSNCLSWNTIYQIFGPRIAAKPFFVYDKYKYMM